MLLPYYHETPQKMRALIRKGDVTTQTSGMCAGYAQANLVILNKTYAEDFALFATLNPKSCPVLEVVKNAPLTKKLASHANITTDLPRYRIYENGVFVTECLDIQQYWQPDLVGFLIGCSFTFESELMTAGINLRHIEWHKNVPMYVTNIPCNPSEYFYGPMVVSMRAIPLDMVDQAIAITSKYPAVHGAPIHIGDPSIIGIEDITKPDYGDYIPIYENEIPVFWACGVTPQRVATIAKPSLIITHAPGHMFISDIPNATLTTW